ncbi:MAG: tryptophan--tRNA ligase, partial [Gammaproteobacteria bacterium]|nr:tryptophan--tRNA ligase [Gammaproteobacteria bacterium]
DCTLFDIYKAFATEDETAAYRARLEAGAGWGDAKQELFEYLDAHLEGPREEYSKLLADPGHVESVLQAGAEKARARSQALISKVREAVGIAALS